MNVLQVQALHAGPRSKPLLTGIELDVGYAEIVAVVGDSGSGKSALLGALSGLVAIASGSVRLYGREVAGRAPEDIVALGLVHVPERRRLFGGLTVRENLLLGGWRTKERDLSRVLDLFPFLVGRLSRPAGSLSGGEQQVCAIARGLMAEPAIMLIDELTLGLAPVMAREILTQLPGIAAAGTSLLITDQDAGIALSIAERGYVLESGHVSASGVSGSLLANPLFQNTYLREA